jgi:hypothetical protein
MSDISRFRMLSTRERAIVALGVLLDGHDATQYLGSDKERSSALTRAAKDLAQLAPDVRMPLVGTLLRGAIRDLKNDKS